MEAVKEDHTKPEAPLLEEAAPVLVASELEIMEDGDVYDLEHLMDDLCEVKHMEERSVKECASLSHLQGLKNEVELVAECTAEYRRNVSQMQNLMCSVPHLQDIMCNLSKGKLVEACTSVDCVNVSDLQGLLDFPSEAELVERCTAEHCEDFPSEAELVEGCMAEHCDNACGLQGITDINRNDVDLLNECTTEDVCYLQNLLDDLSVAQLLEECAAEAAANTAELQGVVTNNLHKMELMKGAGIKIHHDRSHSQGSMDNLSEFKQVEQFSVEDGGSVSHLQGLICNQGSPENLYDLQALRDNPSKVELVEVCVAEDYLNVSDSPGLIDSLKEMERAEKGSAEDCVDISGLQSVMDELHKVESAGKCMPQGRVDLQGLNPRPAYSVAEAVMNMNTVAVFLAQRTSSSADNKIDIMKQHGFPAEATTGLLASSSVGNEADGGSQHGVPGEGNISLLATIMLPQMKILAKQYQKSRGSSLRRALHEAKLMEFRGFGPDPAPDWIPQETFKLLSKHGHIGCVEGSFNPLFDRMWLPWAQSAEFYHDQDVAMVCDQEILHRGLYSKSIASVCLSWAIPTRPVLEYMVAMAPHGRIAEIGSGLGYWAALLKKLGADVIAVDNFSEKASQNALYFPETIPMDGEDFIRQGGAHGRALFFCWPLKSSIQKFTLASASRPIYQTCFAEACLNAFHGDIVFFVGEKGDGCTFDMAAWMQGNPKYRRTWRREKEIDIPSWPGVHDVFMCFVKHTKASNPSFGKKKKKAAKKKAQMEAHSLLSERFIKEEDLLKDAFAAYPDCSIQ